MTKDEIIAELPLLSVAELDEVQSKLDELAARSTRSAAPYHTPSTDAGECLIGSIEDVEAVLNEIEGPIHSEVCKRLDRVRGMIQG